MMLMRFTDGPAPDPNPSTSARHGAEIFKSIGCALCHTPQLQTAPVMNSAVLQDRPVKLFSDLMVHHMGANLADNVVQGQAGPDEFRTTPLWGVGQRIFFLHDGRTSDLLQAIRAHFSPANQDDAGGDQRVPMRLFTDPSPQHAPDHGASEANAVIRRYNDLTVADQQAMLDFLRSL